MLCVSFPDVASFGEIEGFSWQYLFFRVSSIHFFRLAVFFFEFVVFLFKLAVFFCPAGNHKLDFTLPLFLDAISTPSCICGLLYNLSDNFVDGLFVSHLLGSYWQEQRSKLVLAKDN